MTDGSKKWHGWVGLVTLVLCQGKQEGSKHYSSKLMDGSPINCPCGGLDTCQC